MLQTKLGAPAGIGRGPSPTQHYTLARTAVIIAAGLGLATCIGPYADDGYTHNPYRAGPSYDGGYDQRRGPTYRPDPYAALDQRPRQGWWHDNAYAPGRDDR